MATVPAEFIITTTPITSLNNVDFVGSPKHIQITPGETFTNIEIELAVWSGALTAYTSGEYFKLSKSKVSASDNSIIFELSDYIKTQIEPVLSFDTIVEASNETVFWQYIVKIYNGGTTPIVTQFPTTRLATLGYNWYYEGETPLSYNHGSFNFVNTLNDRYLYPFLTYYNPTITLTGATNTAQMVTRTPVQKTTANVKCTELPAIVIYLNKQGFYFAFNVTGNVQAVTTLTRETYQRGTRNPLGGNRDEFHSDRNFNTQSVRKYIINTGLITELMGEQIEELIHSEKVFLILFDGMLGNTGAITVDSTVIKVDSTLITVDATAAAGITTASRQIPVVVTSNEFVRKIQLTDKANIAYTIELTEANNFRNNLR